MNEDDDMCIALYLHDNTPAKPGERHGPDGPTHCGTARVDYMYQAEMKVQEIEELHPHVVRIINHAFEREWIRNSNGKFIETINNSKVKN